MKEEDLHIFKEEVKYDYETFVYYRLIGSDVVYIHDKHMEQVTIMDDSMENSEFCVIYSESQFITEYGGFQQGIEKISIEDLIRLEWTIIINKEKEETAASASELKNMNTEVKTSQFNFNFN